MLRKLRLATFAASCLLMCVSAPAVAQDIVLRFSHGAPETTVKGRTINFFAELVAKYTDGTVKVQVFPGGQLIPDPDELRAVSRGQVDIVAPFTTYFTSLDPVWDIFYQPLLLKDVPHAVSVFGGPVGQNLLQRLPARGLTPLGIWHDGPVYIFTKQNPVTRPEQMKGLKTRTVATRALESMLGKTGAVPVTMPAGDVYLALQQGVMDAVLTTPTYAGPARWNEVLKTGTRMMWGHGGYVAVMNPKSLEKLSPKQREGFMRAAKEAAVWNQEKAIENIKQAENYLTEKGLKWSEISAADREDWLVYSKQVWAEQNDEVKTLIAQINK